MARRIKPTKEQYIKAGAYYRLWKAVSNKAALYIANNITQDAKASDVLMKTCRKIDELEIKIGLERFMDLDYPELSNADFLSVFYGPVPVSGRNITDTAIRNEVINI